MGKKIVRYTLRVVAILLGTALLLLVALYLPPVQDFIQKKAVAYVSANFGMQLSVERLRLKFPLRLAIDHAEAITQAGDTLFTCGTLRADVALLPLLHKEVIVKQFTFGDASFHLNDTTSGLDLQIRVKEFALEADNVDLGTQVAHVSSIRLSGGDVRLALGPAMPDTTVKSNTAAKEASPTPLLWQIVAGKVILDHIAFTMQTSPAVSDLTARITTGHVDSCTVDLGGQTVRATSVLLHKGYFSYVADTTTILPTTPPQADTTVSLPWTVRVGSVRLDDFAGRYGLPYDTPKESFDPSHIEVSGLNLAIDSAFNRGAEIQALLSNLTFTERSGVAVTQAQGRIAMDSAGYALQNFLLQTREASVIRADLFCGAGVTTLDPATRVDADLAVTLASADIARLVPMDETLLRRFAGRNLTLGTQLIGTLGDLNLQKLVVEVPKMLALTATGEIRSATDPDRTEGRLTLSGEVRNPAFVVAFLPKGVGIELPPLRFRGEVRAVPGTYSGRMTLRAAEGRMAVNGSFTPRSQRYRAEVQADSLPLDRFLRNDSLGFVTLALKAEGRGFDLCSPKTTAQADLHITQAEYNRFDYRDITLTAQLADHQLEGRLTSNNAALEADLQINGLLTKQKQEAVIRGDIRTLDLEQAGIVQKPATVSLRLYAEGSATQAKTTSTETTDAGAYAATVILDTLKIRYGTFEEQIPRTVIAASADTSHVGAEVTSGDLKLTFHSSASVDSLTAGFARTATAIQGQIWAGRVNTDTLERLLPPFRLDFNAARNNILNSYLHAQGMGFGQVALSASAAEGKPFGFQAEVNQFSTQGIVLDTLTVGVGGRNSQLQYYARLANRPGNLNRMGMIALYGSAAGNTGQITLTQRDREGRRGVDFGLRATLGDSTVTVNLIPEHPVFGFSEWTVGGGNYIHYGFDRTLAADLTVTRAGQQFSLQTATGEEVPRGSVRLRLAGIQIANALSLLPTAPPLGGRLGTDLIFGLADSVIAARGTLTIDTLRYAGRRVGDIGLNLAYQTDTLEGQQGSLALLIDHRTALSATGRYTPSDSTGVQLTADIPGIPLAAANPFLPEGSGSLSGLLKGHFTASGALKALKLAGSLMFDSTAVQVAAIGTRFGISDNPIVLEGDKVLFKDFALIAPNKRRLTLNGSVEMHDFPHMGTDLTIQATDFQLIQVPRNRGSMLFGQASADLSARVRGPLDALNIRGDVSLLTGTEVTYVMQDSPMGIQDRSQNVVTFKAFNDTTEIYTTRPPSMLALGGVDMLMNVLIDPEVQLSVYLSEDGQNRINLKGGGNLTYAMNRLGDTRFSGKYELSGGAVRYSPPVISTKDFKITPGGYVSWTGDIADPSFSIKAVETVRTTVTMEDQQNRSVNFQISIHISGSLENLDIRFDLAAPEDLTLQNQLASLTPEQRQNQAMSLLIYNSYSGPGTSAKVNTGNPLNSFIAKELNQWAQNSLKGVDLSFGVDSYDNVAAGSNGTRTDYSYKLSKKFFANRVKVMVGGKVSAGGDPSQSAAENLIDDISLEYQLTRRDNMYLKVFREVNFESILEGDVTETGVGFGVRKKVLKLGDLFKLTKEKKEVKAERKEARKAAKEEKRQKRQERKADKGTAVKAEEPALQTED